MDKEQRPLLVRADPVPGDGRKSFEQRMGPHCNFVFHCLCLLSGQLMFDCKKYD